MMTTRPHGILATFLISTFIFSSPITLASINFPEESANDPYHVGKIIYHRKLACTSCPMSKTVIDPSMYKSVIERLNTDKELMTALDENERTAVAYYLETLFTPH